jgi:hypothetical protein
MAGDGMEALEERADGHGGGAGRPGGAVEVHEALGAGALNVVAPEWGGNSEVIAG